MRTAVAFLLLASAAPGLTGCGGGDTTVIERTETETAPGPETDTAPPETDAAPSDVEASDDQAQRVSFGLRAGRICSRASDQSDKVRGGLGLEPGQTEFESTEQGLTVYRRENAIRRDLLRRLRALEAPASLRVRFERYLAGFERLQLLFDGLIGAASADDTDRARELGRQIRLRVRRNRRLAAAAALGRCGR